jgi:hypothetical protein
MSYDEMKEIAKEYKVPYTKRLKDLPKDPKELINKIYNEKEKIEGYVICFNDGDFYKVKTNIYSCSHRYILFKIVYQMIFQN